MRHWPFRRRFVHLSNDLLVILLLVVADWNEERGGGRFRHENRFESGGDRKFSTPTKSIDHIFIV